MRPYPVPVAPNFPHLIDRRHIVHSRMIARRYHTYSWVQTRGAGEAVRTLAMDDLDIHRRIDEVGDDSDGGFKTVHSRYTGVSGPSL